jgi:hypothetical protein
VLTHQFRELGDRGVRTNPLDALVHRVFDFHGGPLLLELGAFDAMPEPIPTVLLFQVYRGAVLIAKSQSSVASEETAHLRCEACQLG